MPPKRRVSKQRLDSLTDDQEWELLLGGGRVAAFASESEKRRLYFLHRDSLSWGHGRIAAWWLYEAKGPRLVVRVHEVSLGAQGSYTCRDLEGELEALTRLGQATPAEVALFKAQLHRFRTSDLLAHGWAPAHQLEDYARGVRLLVAMGHAQPGEFDPL